MVVCGSDIMSTSGLPQCLHMKGDWKMGVTYASGRARVYGLMAVLVLALCAGMVVGADAAYASPGDVKNLKGTVHVSHWKGDWPISYTALDKGKISNAKSSNKKVATVKAVKASKKTGGYPSLQITKKKAGTTKITFTYKGKKKSFKLKVHKYVNPMKSFKVGTKEYASFFKTADTGSKGQMTWDEKTGTYTVGVLRVVPKKGWKIKQIEVFNYTTYKSKVVKNGYKLKKDESLSSVWMKHKSGLEEWYPLG